MKSDCSIGVVLDSIMVQRLANGLVHQFAAHHRVWVLDLYRPVEELIRTIRARRPAGLITRWAEEVGPRLADLGLPTVAYSCYERRANVVSVDVDNVAVGVLAAQHLLDRGLRSFAYIGRGFPYSDQRGEGFKRTLARAGQGCAGFDLSMPREQYFEYARPERPMFARWLAALVKPVGVFTAFDKVAWQVTEVCRQQGLRIPDDVMVVGVNDDPLFCGLARPTVSSIRIPWDQIGSEMARALDRALARGGARSLSAGPILVEPTGVTVRESTDHVAVPDPVLSRALRVLATRASEPLAIKGVAGLSFCSRRRLETLFRQHLGRSPRQHLERLRIERAKDLLQRTELPIALIAERCGYSYPERFAVAFKRNVGATPSAFRRRGRAVPAGMPRP